MYIIIFQTLYLIRSMTSEPLEIYPVIWTYTGEIKKSANLKTTVSMNIIIKVLFFITFYFVIKVQLSLFYVYPHKSEPKFPAWELGKARSWRVCKQRRRGPHARPRENINTLRW